MEIMNMKQVISTLQTSGVNITYRHRTDGGYRITSINGQKYRGSTGNAVARGMAGARLAQDSGQFGTRRGTRTELSSELEKELRRTQRLWRKNFGTHSAAGVVKRKNVVYNVKKYGEEETLRLLKNQSLYAKGIAYPENVEFLAQRFDSAANFSKNHATEWASIAAKIRSLKGVLRDRDLEETYRIMGSPKVGERLDLGEAEQIERIKNILSKY